ncbi:hypothetical protein BPA30113_04850 [Burkholderia paludis]|uniref:Uncharacterized protein n=1 Tax=Burkholderia paludis TaxID=1506587 RepID=A0A6P2P8X3_9BURK|nr:hypothetical protein BPA30113_04850 [Burkholderia paludis]
MRRRGNRSRSRRGRRRGDGRRNRSRRRRTARRGRHGARARCRRGTRRRKRHGCGRRRRHDRRRHLDRLALRRRRGLGQRCDGFLFGLLDGGAIAPGRIDLQEMVDEVEEALIEHAGGNRLARGLDERIVARPDRQRQRAEQAEADAGRRIRLLQRVAVLHRVHVRDARRAVRVRVRAHDVKLDHDVHVVVRLEILAAVDRVVARRRRHIALAQQRAPRGLAGRVGLRMERVRVRAAGRVELLLLVDRLGRRRARCQHGRGRERARSGKQAKSVVHGVFQKARRDAAQGEAPGWCARKSRMAGASL